MTVRDVLGNSEIPRRDAEFLLLHCVGQADRGWLIAHNLDEVPIQALDDFKAACQQRALHGQAPLEARSLHRRR